MLASKVTRKTLESAAAEIGVTLDMTSLNSAGTRHRVKVNPGARDGERFESPSGRKGSPMSKYQRISTSTFNGGRRVHAVCWHGFRDFFRAVYRREPGAVFKTAFDTWKGSEDFEARFAFSGHRNIGSQVAPMMAAEACVCPSSGYAG
jgi:hypothetical protein